MKEKVGTASKQPAVKAATKKAGKTTASQVVHVVAFHSHTDDYKRAESSSDVRAVYQNIRPAHKFCILKNFEENYDLELETYSKTLFKLLEKDGSGSEIGDITDKVTSLENAAILKKIYTELIEALGENSQGEYTMNASQNVYSVHTKTVTEEE